MNPSSLKLQAKRASVRCRAALLGALLLQWALCASADTPTYYWDLNGSDPGAGDSLTGDWYNITPCWTEDPYGNSPTFTYPNRASLVFAATGDDDWTDTGDYTVTVHGITPVSDLTFKDGNCTLTTMPPDYLDKDTPYVSVLNQGQIAILNSVIASAPGTANGLTKYARGTLVLGCTNTYHGPTTIEGGTLLLAGPQLIPSGSSLVLGNGGTGGYVDTPPTFATDGFSQTLGPLSLVGGNVKVQRALDLAKGHGTLAFADSSAQDWNGIPLTILNYSNGVSALRFGTNSAGLTPQQLALIQFRYVTNGYPLFVPAKIDANGFVTPTSPLILSLTPYGPTSWIITWRASSGSSYLVHFKQDLSDAGWSTISQTIVAPGSTASVTNSVGSDTRRLYWVEPLPFEPPG